jgi:hypothetical protein
VFIPARGGNTPSRGFLLVPGPASAGLSYLDHKKKPRRSGGAVLAVVRTVLRWEGASLPTLQPVNADWVPRKLIRPGTKLTNGHWFGGVPFEEFHLRHNHTGTLKAPVPPGAFPRPRAPAI